MGLKFKEVDENGGNREKNDDQNTDIASTPVYYPMRMAD